MEVIRLDGVIKSNFVLHLLEDQMKLLLLHMVTWAKLLLILQLNSEHYIQPGSISVINAVAEEVNSGNVNSVFHIGDISYATGFLVEWEYFLDLINPVASQIPYMTAIGNHERDYINSGSVYITPDSGGECGVAYESYFQMPTSAMDKP